MHRYAVAEIDAQHLAVFGRTIGHAPEPNPLRDDTRGGLDIRVLEDLPAGQIVEVTEVIEGQQRALRDPKIRVEGVRHDRDIAPKTEVETELDQNQEQGHG